MGGIIEQAGESSGSSDQERLDRIFRAYDIRGLVPEELNADIARDIARAFADTLPDGIVAVGRDMRTDSEQLATAFIDGLIQQGREVLDVGMITSDMISFTVGQYDLAGGAMITASHNPGEYDGIKLTAAGVSPVGIDSGLLEIKQAVIDQSFHKVEEVGRKLEKNILSDWVEHALRFAGSELKPLKVGIDAGNGMGALAVPKLQELTPLDISGLYMELDGTFPNHPANPILPEAIEDLQTLVRRNELDLGIAFDGDGDRCFVVDETGEAVTSSEFGALLAATFLKENEHACVVYNAVIGDIVPETVEGLGGKAIRSKVGHTYVQEQMRSSNAVFGCEGAGHFFFRDNFFADSGLIAAVMVLGIMSETDKKLSELIGPYKKYAHIVEEDIKTNQGEHLIAALKQHYSQMKCDELDGLTIRAEDWWANIRPSNTEPYVRINLEAKNRTVLTKAHQELSSLVKKFTA
ncbi:phosphomannomutase/phosphoglucomutase [bacterium]|nr:phosphomannomutase/phosphoglucomutase [bacterium]